MVKRAIIRSQNSCVSSINDAEEQEDVTHSSNLASVTVRKGTRVPLAKLHIIQVRTALTGLQKIFPLHPGGNETRKKLIVTVVVIDVATNQPFCIRVSNFSNKNTNLRKEKKISIASRLSGCMIQLVVRSNMYHTDVDRDVIALPIHENPIPHEIEISRHEHVMSADRDASKSD